MAVSVFGVILIPFVFTVLVLLLIKSPKAGAVFAGVLVCLVLAGFLGVRFHGPGAGGHIRVAPLFVMVVPFVFVLLVLLLTKAPKVGIGVLVALVAMGVAFFVAIPVSHRRGADHALVLPPIGTTSVPTLPEHMDRVFESPAVGSEPSGRSPIWSEGIEREFDADVYASAQTAARALGSRMVAPIRKVAADPNMAVELILFQEGTDRNLVTEFARVIEKELPEVRCVVEADLRNIGPREIGLTFRLSGARQVVDYTADGDSAGRQVVKLKVSTPVESGRIVATAFKDDRRSSAEVDFVDKPWVEGFASFASLQPDQHLIVARSNGACTSEGQANQQALEDARAQVAQAVDKRIRGKLGKLDTPAITSMDVLEGDFIVDRFVQSLDGSAGKIWRQALLVDVSPPGLIRLVDLKARQMRGLHVTWARMIGSAVGVVALIAVIYFFLNMATRGYYEWSLRIAGMVLAIVAVISVLMMVQ